MKSVQEVVFGQNPNQTWHAFRRVDRVGLGRSAVMNAILADLTSRLPLPFPPPNNAPFVGMYRQQMFDCVTMLTQ
jgi:hypothetical protein